VAPHSSPPGASSTAHRRTLVVDDEALLRWAPAEALSDGGHTVTEAGDAAAARSAVAATSDAFDVIVLDLRLPDSQDLSLLTALRRAAPGAAAILMSAHMTPETHEAALAAGGHAVAASGSCLT
jgi:DNA-binding NtrC family response regulator